MSVQGAWLYWFVGLTAVFAVWWLTTSWRSRFARNQTRAITMAIGLGVAMVRVKGVLIFAPSTQLIVQGLSGGADAKFRLNLGVAYFSICWMAALLVLFFWRPRKSIAKASSPLPASFSVSA